MSIFEDRKEALELAYKQGKEDGLLFYTLVPNYVQHGEVFQQHNMTTDEIKEYIRGYTDATKIRND